MKSSIGTSVLLVTIISFLSKIVGFLREAVFSYYLGTSFEADTFFLAYSSLNSVIAILGVSIGMVYLPIYLETRQNKGKDKATRQTAIVLNQLSVVGIVLTFLCYFFSEKIATILAPTYDEYSLAVLGGFVQKLSIVVVFGLHIHLVATVLDALKHFVLSRVIGMLYSLISILFLVLFYRVLGVKTLVLSVLVAYVFQWIISFYAIFRRGGYSLRLRLSSLLQKQIYLRTFAVMIGTGTLYVGQVVDKVIASSLDVGSIAALNYSGTIHSVINTLFVASIVSVFYTSLSEEYILGNINRVASILSKSTNMLLFILLPITAFSMIASEDIIRVVFMRGAFNENSLALTSSAFFFYVMGAPFFGYRNLLTRVFYAAKDTRTPMINGVVSIILNIVIALVLVFVLNLDIRGITIASSVAAAISCLILHISLRSKEKKLFEKQNPREFFKLLISTIISAIVIIVISPSLCDINSLFRLMIIAMLLIIIYVSLLWLLNSAVFISALSLIKLRMGKYSSL